MKIYKSTLKKLIIECINEVLEGGRPLQSFHSDDPHLTEELPKRAKSPKFKKGSTVTAIYRFNKIPVDKKHSYSGKIIDSGRDDETGENIYKIKIPGHDYEWHFEKDLKK